MYVIFYLFLSITSLYFAIDSLRVRFNGNLARIESKDSGVGFYLFKVQPVTLCLYLLAFVLSLVLLLKEVL